MYSYPQGAPRHRVTELLDDIWEPTATPSITTVGDYETRDANEWEDTELRIYHTASDGNTTIQTQHHGHFYFLQKFWSAQISLNVPHKACRDHLGTLRSLVSTSSIDNELASP